MDKALGFLLKYKENVYNSFEYKLMFEKDRVLVEKVLEGIINSYLSFLQDELDKEPPQKQEGVVKCQ